MKHFKKYTFLCLLIFSLFLIITPKSGHPYDIFCWQEWAKQIFNSGLGNVYHSFTDYLPLYHYILKIYASFQNTADEVGQNIYYLKFVSLLFHFITGYLIFCLVRGNKENWDIALLNILFYLLNVAVLYNGMIWGQVDIILTCFVFISIYLALRHKALLSLIFYSLPLTLNYTPSFLCRLLR